MSSTDLEYSIKQNKPKSIGFSNFNLNPLILQALESIGYETPSPIQAEIIPILCQGKDVIGQAQTGTGKTAAFALPLLDKLEINFSDADGRRLPQALVLAPTRELAIQVADSFRQYSANMKGLVITTLCGGQDYRSQLKDLKNGAHVIVGTPGRVIDHINRGTLDISKVETLVLDEADEMLRMGFIDDVDWILSHTPQEKQIALFSATMPFAIKAIADRYLRDPECVTIKPKTETTNLIGQYYWGVSYQDKITTLMRILEVSKYDDMDAMIVFARTKVETMTIGEKLLANGYRAIVLNGDIEQKMRERSINEIKSGRTDILIATDVAARGLDIDRITHVINYDMPHDQETYLHRIGRTGRAGRKGTAITFVTRSENFKLSQIERFTKINIEKYKMPTVTEINKQRVKSFKAKVLEILELSKTEHSAKKKEFQEMVNILNQIGENTDFNGFDVAAAVSMLLHNNAPLLLNEHDVISDSPTHHGKNKDRPKSNNFNKSRSNFDDRADQNRNRRSRFNDDGASQRNSRGEGRGSFRSGSDNSRARSEGRRSFRDSDTTNSRSGSGASFNKGERSRNDNSSASFKSKFKPKVSVNTRGGSDFSFEKSGQYTNRKPANTEKAGGRPSVFNNDFGSSDSQGRRSGRNARSGGDHKTGRVAGAFHASKTSRTKSSSSSAGRGKKRDR